MVYELLKQLGLGDKEIAVYLTVLQQGKITHADVSKLTKINRTTVYSVAKELVDRGIITEDLGETKTYLIAKPPQELISYVEKQKAALEKQSRIAEKAVMELQTLAGEAKYSIPKVVFIPEDKLGDYLYKQTPAWNDSIQKTDGVWWGFQDASFIKHYEKWIDWYWEEGSPKNAKLKLFSNQTAENIKRKKFANRIIKYWQGSKNLSATTWINGDYIIMIVTSQRPHYLVEIHDSVMANNFREVFKGIWQEIDS